MFSEFVVILREHDITYLNCAVMEFEALHGMHRVKPFKLVVLLEVPDSLQWDTEWRLGFALDSVTAKGLLDFHGSPPTVRITRLRQVRWHIEFRHPEFD